MTPLTITLPFALPGKGRARVTRRGTFTPAATVAAENMVKAAALEQIGLPRLIGPLEVIVAIYREVPPRWSKRNRADALAGRLLPTSKPDLSNSVKSAEDPLNQIAWADDAQIVKLTVTKQYAETAKTVITINHV